MATLTIRNLNAELESKLRDKAAQDGHSVEEEAELLLRRALSEVERPVKLGSYIHELFADLGGVELEFPSRSGVPRIPDLSE
jgi:antitoxin FitA